MALISSKKMVGSGYRLELNREEAAMTPKQLEKIVEQMVQKALRKHIPLVVEEFLTEKYLRGIVNESVASKKRSAFLDDDLDEPEDDHPRPPKNDHQGVYHDLNVRSPKTESRDVLRKLISPEENPYAFAYEGTRPLTESSEEEEVPLDAIMAMTRGASQFANRMESVATSRARVQSTETAEERRLAELRRKLDEQVVPKVR